MSQVWSVEHTCQGILLAAWAVGLTNSHLMKEQTEAWQGRRDVCIIIQNPSVADLDFAQSLPGSEYLCAWHSIGQNAVGLLTGRGLLPESVRKLMGMVIPPPHQLPLPRGCLYLSSDPWSSHPSNEPTDTSY